MPIETNKNGNETGSDGQEAIAVAPETNSTVEPQAPGD